MDDQSWIWSLVSSQFEKLSLEHVRLPSSTPIRQSWERLKNAERVVIHWESAERSGGAIVEEILDVSPQFNVSERLVVVTTNPTHEDVVYFSELGVRKIIRLRNRDKDLHSARRELLAHLSLTSSTDVMELAWQRLLYKLDHLPDDASSEAIGKLEDALSRLKPDKETARYLDAMATIAMYKEDDEAAIRGWHSALDKNPNYYRTYHNLIAFYRKKGERKNALALMQKMHELNKSNVSRLVGMGEIQLEMDELERAEFYFTTALDRDRYCSGALNGLAEIRFYQGELDESRQLLAKSHLAYKAASKFNKIGIELVKKARFEDALEHYTKAQYVLPQQDKGPMLFYNIGLCYSRWGKPNAAREFLRIALIKEPNYKKAKRLLEQIDQSFSGTEMAV